MPFAYSRAVIALLVIALLSLGYAAVSVNRVKTSVSIPVKPEELLGIIRQNESARIFMDKYFLNESERIERTALAYDKKNSRFVWEVEIQEKACGCAINGTEGVNLLKASIDPVTGKMYSVDMRLGIKEAQLQRESCEKGCHE